MLQKIPNEAGSSNTPVKKVSIQERTPNPSIVITSVPPVQPDNTLTTDHTPNTPSSESSKQVGITAQINHCSTIQEAKCQLAPQPTIYYADSVTTGRADRRCHELFIPVPSILPDNSASPQDHAVDKITSNIGSVRASVHVVHAQEERPNLPHLPQQTTTSILKQSVTSDSNTKAAADTTRDDDKPSIISHCAILVFSVGLLVTSAILLAKAQRLQSRYYQVVFLL